LMASRGIENGELRMEKGDSRKGVQNPKWLTVRVVERFQVARKRPKSHQLIVVFRLTARAGRVLRYYETIECNIRRVFGCWILGSRCGMLAFREMLGGAIKQK